MNIATKIVLSLSLVALITQSTQAKPWISDKNKKIAKHSAQILAGFLALAAGRQTARTASKIQNRLNFHSENYSHCLEVPKATRNESQKGFIKNYELVSRSKNIKLGIATTSISTGLAFLYYGIKGLKKEICPNLDPIAWMKNKQSNKTQRSA